MVLVEDESVMENDFKLVGLETLVLSTSFLFASVYANMWKGVGIWLHMLHKDSGGCLLHQIRSLR